MSQPQNLGTKQAVKSTGKNVYSLDIDATTTERLEALSPAQRAIMARFGYEHLKRDDLKETSKILHDAMLALCEILPDVDDVKDIGAKIWEGKNLAVELKVRT